MALKDFFANIPPKQKILLVVLLFVAVIAGYYFAIYRGMAAEKASLTKQRDQLIAELNQKRLLAANLERLKTEIAQLEKDLSLALQVLPEQKEIPTLLKNVNRSGQEAGVDFRLFRPGPLTARDFFSELPVTIRVQGTYHGLGRFFDKISKMPRIINVSDLKITPIPPSKEIEDTILAEFTATTFVFAGNKGGKGSEPTKRP